MRLSRLFTATAALVVLAAAPAMAQDARPAATDAQLRAQIEANDLSPRQARALQARVDRVITRTGGIQVAINQVVWDGGDTLVPLPGERRARELGPDSVVHGHPVRVEHLDVALNHGKTAALNMLGRNVDHEEIPYFFSDLADWSSMEYAGLGGGRVVVRGSMDDGAFTAFYLGDEGAVVGALTVGPSDDLEVARRMIREKARPDEGALADKSTDLGQM